MNGRARRLVHRLPLPVAASLARMAFVPPDRRIAAARYAAEAYLESGRNVKAEAAVSNALAVPGRRRKQTDLLDDVVSGVLASGQEPRLLGETVRSHLRLADAQFGRGRTRAAAESFARAMKLAFDPMLHFDGETSPMAPDPHAFTAPLGASSFMRSLRAPRGRTVVTDAEGGSQCGAERQQKIVVATRGNANFLAEILGMLAEHPDVDAQFVDLADHKRVSRGINNTALLAEEIITGRHGLARRVERFLRPYLHGTDLLFLEWCNALPVLTGLVDPRDTRVVVRLHSFEAFTRWPHLLDFSRIDDMVFVSELSRDFAVDAIPGLREENAPRLHVVPLAKELRRYVRPKSDEARFNVALVGWGHLRKQPLWAFEVLRRLRSYDERYRLHLVGSGLPDRDNPRVHRYHDQVRRELPELEARGLVRRVAQTDDVPGALTDVGVILSSSVRESFHAALVEGAASGAVPVVRDWPFFAGRPTSARTLFPSDWVVDTPDQAARRILDLTADPATWRAAGAAASDHALATWDLEVTRPLYEQLLLG